MAKQEITSLGKREADLPDLTFRDLGNGCMDGSFHPGIYLLLLVPLPLPLPTQRIRQYGAPMKLDQSVPIEKQAFFLACRFQTICLVRKHEHNCLSRKLTVKCVFSPSLPHTMGVRVLCLPSLQGGITSCGGKRGLYSTSPLVRYSESRIVSPSTFASPRFSLITFLKWRAASCGISTGIAFEIYACSDEVDAIDNE